MKPQELLHKLSDACRGGMSAVRIVTRLGPAGGQGDKLFPPTYEGGRYASEKRRLNGQEIETVLLDAVQSQANRMEQALLEALRAGQCDMPILQVRIPRSSGETIVTTLDAPHRIFDAIFRDSTYQGRKFRDSPLGKRLVEARLDNATALFETCPTALLFGAWDSTGGGGVMGNRVARALTSEIIGLNAVYGRRTSSRIDPLGIKRDAADIYQSESDLWTLSPESATKDAKGKAVKYGKTGRPSEINHGNIAPSITEDVQPQDITFENELRTDEVSHRLSMAFRRPVRQADQNRPTSGGVTISEALQTTVLSFPQLRRLHFPDVETREPNPERDVAGRAVLAALGLYAVALQREQGYFLRSRCHLVPLEPARYQFLGVTAQDLEEADITTELARDAFDQARQRAKKVGLVCEKRVIQLEPTEKLVELVRRSDAKLGTEEDQSHART